MQVPPIDNLPPIDCPAHNEHAWFTLPFDVEWSRRNTHFKGWGYVDCSKPHSEHRNDLFGRCQSMSTVCNMKSCAQHGYLLYKHFRWREDLFLEWVNPDKGSANYRISIGCRLCCRKTREFNPQYYIRNEQKESMAELKTHPHVQQSYRVFTARVLGDKDLAEPEDGAAAPAAIMDGAPA